MIVHCVDSTNNRDVLYGMGQNNWGQLGTNPVNGEIFRDHLGIVEPQCIDINAFQPKEVACGLNHTLILYKQRGFDIHETLEVIQLGNITANQLNEHVVFQVPRGKKQNRQKQ